MGIPLSGADITSDRTLAAALRRWVASSAKRIVGKQTRSAAKIRFKGKLRWASLNTADGHAHDIVHTHRLFYDKRLSVFYADEIAVKPGNRSEPLPDFFM